jgi:hypothetical protein
MVWFGGDPITAQLSGQSHCDIRYERSLLLVIEYFLFAIGLIGGVPTTNHHSN